MKQYPTALDRGFPEKNDLEIQNALENKVRNKFYSEEYVNDIMNKL